MGYRGFAEPERRQMTYMKPEKGVILNVSQGIVYDHNNNLVARSALALVMELNRREGQPISREQALGWLADRYSEHQARAASLVEHEQATEEFLAKRAKARSRTIALPREHKLERRDPERTRTRENDRDQDRDHGFSR